MTGGAHGETELGLCHSTNGIGCLSTYGKEIL